MFKRNKDEEYTTWLQTSEGLFKVKYTGYYPGFKGSQYEPPEPESVEILDFYFCEDSICYCSSYDDLVKNSRFISELERLVIQYINDLKYEAEEDHMWNLYEDRMNNHSYIN